MLIKILMATPRYNFDDIRIIICAHGYSLDYQYVVREIGFWTNGVSGSISFNCKINKRQLDGKTLRTIRCLEEEIHGIKLNKRVDNGLALSDINAVLRTLYHMSDDNKAKCIGICRDENIKGLLYKAGLGNYVVEIDNLLMFDRTTDKCPSNPELQIVMQNNPNKYVICNLHDNLKTYDYPICSKVKAQYIGEYCKEYQYHVNSQKL
ncbi:MAG: hypothetical protein ACREQ5_26150 [Candidatus Dormibacteria bacterium]